MNKERVKLSIEFFFSSGFLIPDAVVSRAESVRVAAVKVSYVFG